MWASFNLSRGWDKDSTQRRSRQFPAGFRRSGENRGQRERGGLPTGGEYRILLLKEVRDMEEKRVRISDIAQELGLSTATVSNVLHGKTKKTSDETVRRVQAALEQHQYIPSMAGILLAQNDSRIIGVVINDHEKYEGRALEDVFIASSLNHLSTQIDRRGLFMMVKKTTDPQEIIRFASMWNLEGLVLIGFCDQDYVYLRSHMRIPFVVYDGYCSDAPGVFNITIDDFDGGAQVGKHLKERGHRRALCVADNFVCMDKARCEGFMAAFAPGEAEFLLLPMQAQARRALYREKLSYLRSFTAVFAVSDAYAIELMQFLQEQGVSVPREMAVVGFDDTPMCRMVTPALTSVRQDGALRAAIALEKLQALKEHRSAETTTCLGVTLMVRESTGGA